MSNIDDQYIDKYLLDQLDEKERMAFLKILTADDGLQKQVALRKVIIKGVKNTGRDKLKDRLKLIHQEEINPVPKIRRMWPLISSVAVAIALLIVSGVYLFSNQKLSPQLVFEEFYQAHSLSLASRDVDNEKELLVINELYNDEKYKAVLPLFKEVLLKEPTNARMLLGAGICHLELNQLEEARSQFLAIIEANDLRLQDKANWYLALSFLKEGKLQEVKSYLEPLSNNVNADQHKQAIALLKSL